MLIADGPKPADRGTLPMTEVHRLLLVRSCRIDQAAGVEREAGNVIFPASHSLLRKSPRACLCGCANRPPAPVGEGARKVPPTLWHHCQLVQDPLSPGLNRRVVD